MQLEVTDEQVRDIAECVTVAESHYAFQVCIASLWLNITIASSPPFALLIRASEIGPQASVSVHRGPDAVLRGNVG